MYIQRLEDVCLNGMGSVIPKYLHVPVFSFQMWQMSDVRLHEETNGRLEQESPYYSFQSFCVPVCCLETLKVLFVCMRMSVCCVEGGTEWRTEEEAGENCIARGCIICTACRILPGSPGYGGLAERGMRHMGKRGVALMGKTGRKETAWKT
jgi:hypothetical protein